MLTGLTKHYLRSNGGWQRIPNDACVHVVN